MMNRWRVAVLVALLVTSTVAYSGLPALAMLVEPAANFVGGLVLRSVGRQAVISVGVAANDASWLVSTSSLVGRAAAILGIAGLTFEYEIPTLPDTPVPKPEVVKPATGELGTYGNPIPYDDPRVRVTALPTNCQVPASQSTDGVTHQIAGGEYESWAALIAACEAVQSYRAGMPAGTTVVNRWFSEGDPVSYTYAGVQRFIELIYVQVLKTPSAGNYAVLYPYGSGMTIRLNDDVADGVKRFIRTAEGFKPDSSDPDWTEGELAAMNNPGVIQFRSADSIVNVSATAQSTKIQAATQVGTDVRYRDVVLNADAVPTSSSEQLVKSASVGDVLASETSTGTGTDIEFPSDYARQGEAATAAAAVTNKLDTLHEDLTVAGQAPADLIAPDASTFEQGFFNGTFTNLLEWNLPAHTSTCPTAAINFDFFGQPFNVNMNAQCLILADETVSNTAQTAFVVLWILVALFIVLGA